MQNQLFKIFQRTIVHFSHRESKGNSAFVALYTMCGIEVLKMAGACRSDSHFHLRRPLSEAVRFHLASSLSTLFYTSLPDRATGECREEGKGVNQFDDPWMERQVGQPGKL